MDETGGQRETLNPAELSSWANLAAEMNHNKMNELECEPGAPSEDMEAEDEHFRCLVCLELVYKPIVQACGHIYCFWCIHRAMSNVGVSHCPLCRSPYNHFPRVCELLHFFLLKAFPVAYRQRAEQVLEEERGIGTFSPQFDDPQTAETVDAGFKLDISACLEMSSPGESSQGELITESGLAKECNNIINAADRLNNGTQSRHSSSLCHESSSSLETSIDINTCVSDSEVYEKSKPNLNLCDKVSVDDVLCCFCKELLYRPTMLNCGHAFCESCISINEDGKLICEACQSLHPGDRPNVCLELHYYLEHVFPIEYAQRKESVLVQQEMHRQSEDYGACTKEDEGATAETPQTQWQGIMIHSNVGCDSCGMMPIIGKRFQCQDCSEKIGFDLCENCYERDSMHHGRFNQQHTAEHSFREVGEPVFYEHSLTPDLVGRLLWTSLVAANSEDQQDDDDGFTVYTRQWPASGNSTQSSDTPD